MKRQEKLDSRTIRDLEQMLTAKRAALKDSLQRAMAQRSSAEARRDGGTWAGESLHEEIAVALVDHRSRQMTQIEAALQRLARREYGTCQDCGELIGLGRLRALPFAQWCTPCQSRAEIPRPHAAPPIAAIPAEDD